MELDNFEEFDDFDVVEDKYDGLLKLEDFDELDEFFKLEDEFVRSDLVLYPPVLLQLGSRARLVTSTG